MTMMQGRAPVWAIAVPLIFQAAIMAANPPSPCGSENTLVANVVALDQPYMFNRLGTANPQGMIFALERDVVPMNPGPSGLAGPTQLQAGNVRLRDDKRARPLVLRVNVGSCLQINFRNLLDPALPTQLSYTPPGSTQTANMSDPVRYASIHLSGLDLVSTILSDGSYVGTNQSGVLPPEQGGPKYMTYTYFAPAEGVYMLYSSADNESNNSNGQVLAGMFGAVNVEPRHAEYYRSQVTREQLRFATFSANDLPPNMRLAPLNDTRGRPQHIAVRRSMFSQEVRAPELTRQLNVLTTVDERQQTFHNATVVESPDAARRLYAIDAEHNEDAGHPIINYASRYPASHPTLACAPVLQMAARQLAPSGGNCVPLQTPRASSISKAAAAVITTAQPHGLSAGSSIVIYKATGDWASLNGVYAVTPMGPTRFSVPVDSSAFSGNFDGALALPDVLYYSDLTAIITGPDAGMFSYADISPTFNQNPAEPERREPYREFTIHYHNPSPVQPFQEFNNPNLSGSYQAIQDNFGINYGVAGIGPEILANRLGVGPEGNADAVDLKFEEFFLSSWAVGDPAMVVDVPANAPNQTINQTSSPASGLSQVQNIQAYQNNTFNPLKGRATQAYYADDPSNVYHSYLRDHVKFRILHAGPGAAHVHHLHAHQWLRTPNSDDGHYLDSQMLTPGAAYTLEIAYGGSGNRNLTPGDSIFHCHFYPHFAAGMWSLWRVHDVFEGGTELDAKGKVKPGINRALPDGEIVNGTPIPAIVPLPTLAMPPIPADVALTEAYPATSAGKDTRRVCVLPDGVKDPDFCNKPAAPGAKLTYSNPGFPFFVPGVAGHRPPHPPLDFAWKVDDDGKPVLQNGQRVYLNGGLPRHVVLSGKIYREAHTRWDFTKDFVLYDAKHNLTAGNLRAFELPEGGTAVERAAMMYHSQRAHRSFLPNGDAGNFLTNGLPPAHGAPFASPGVTDTGDSNVNNRRYKAAAVQMDVVLNKAGWHFPQQRTLMLWEDVNPTVTGARPPQPFFFRANTGETVEYWHTNLVPNYYEMDDFQVRTPTDIIGQHIHLVKFDVLASDGAENGFNYEDGTFSPDEVRERIFAINHSCQPSPGGQHCGLFKFDDGPRQFFNPNAVVTPPIQVQPYRTTYARNNGTSIFGDPPFGQNWDGAQTTIQLWDTDPLLNNRGVDRTLRTVFTHDHFGPSTHQQAGLYGGLLVEPYNSLWDDPITGNRLYDNRCYDSSGKPLETLAFVCPAGSSRKRIDGGPTTWQAIIKTPDVVNSYREFALEFQDMQLAYTSASSPAPAIPTAAAALNFTLSAQPSAGTVSTDIVAAFNAAGIPLTSSAKIDTTLTVCHQFQVNAPPVALAQWHIHDPNPPDQNQDYCLGNVNPTTGKTQPPNTYWAYTPTIEPGWASPNAALLSPQTDGTGINGNPSPSVISSSTNGTESLNYRNEPVPLRILDASSNPLPGTSGDLSWAFSSIPSRAQSQVPCQPAPGALITKPCEPPVPACDNTKQHCPFVFPQPLEPGAQDPSGVQTNDPFTPLLRAYQNDNVQIRTLVGAHVALHSFELQGMNWLTQPTYTNSGYRSAQGMGLSEHYEMLLKLPPATVADGQHPFTDYLYQTNAGTDGVVNGLWGLLRSFTLGNTPYPTLQPLPNNTTPTPAPTDVCAAASNRDHPRTFNIAAQPASTLTYYSRTVSSSSEQFVDPNAMVYVNLDNPGPNPGNEPLILRARAGECIEVTLSNAIPKTLNFTFTTNIIQSSPFGVPGGLPNNISLPVSSTVGLHPQLLAYDMVQSNGANAGFNQPSTVQAGDGPRKLRWFAGKADGTPVEFGTVLLEASDALLQHFTGLMGVLVIEPPGSSWTTDTGTQAMATVIKPDLTSFREMVLMFQNDVENQNLQTQDQKFSLTAALNYKTEPTKLRIAQAGTPPAQPSPTTQLRALNRPVDQIQIKMLGKENAAAGRVNTLAATPGAGTTQTPAPPVVARYSNDLFPSGTNPIPPQTPVLTAGAGDPVRVRIAWGGGTAVNNSVFDIHGHSWQENPWIHGSTELGYNPLAQTFGMEQMVPFQSANILLASAGGAAKVPGDYLYEMFDGEQSNAPGAWGLLRVNQVDLRITDVTSNTAHGTIRWSAVAGSQQPAPGPVTITLWSPAGKACDVQTTSLSAGQTVPWSCQAPSPMAPGTHIVATSSIGGRVASTTPAPSAAAKPPVRSGSTASSNE